MLRHLFFYLAILLSTQISNSVFGSEMVLAQCDHITPPPLIKHKKFRRKLSPINSSISFNYQDNGILKSSRKIDLAGSFVATEQNYIIGAKLLLLAASNDPNEDAPAIQFVSQTLNSYGIPFDTLILSHDKKKVSNNNLPLYTKDGSPKYYGIITTSGQLTYINQLGIEASVLNQQQWINLIEYENRYSIRRVSMYSYPHAALGVEKVSSIDQSSSIRLRVGNEALRFDQSIPINAKVNLSHSWYYFTKITNPYQVKPFLFYETKRKFPANSIAGVISSFNDGREQMHFFFSQSLWNIASQLIAGTWVNWVTKGHYIGKRRIYLSAQVDDIFIATQLWQKSNFFSRSKKAKIIRITGNDIKAYTDWQKEFRGQINNATFRTELAFNGSGLELYADKNGVDKLFNQAIQDFNEYYWVSHTYTHANLDDTNYEQTSLEIKDNLNFISPLLQNTARRKLFSPNSLVPPRISGLFNPLALEAMKNSKIDYVIGDNSREELKPLHPYTARPSTLEHNNFAGPLIIPRHATNIYYNTHIKSELVDEYNHHYKNELSSKLNFSEIYDRESQLTAGYLLTFDPAPYMFHQANMSFFKYKDRKISLLSYWFEKVAAKVQKISNLPILNLKMQDLANLYEKRMQFNTCQINPFFHYKNAQLVFLSGTMQKDCEIPFTASKQNLLNSKYKIEHYGSDKTITIRPQQERNFRVAL